MEISFPRLVWSKIWRALAVYAAVRIYAGSGANVKLVVLPEAEKLRKYIDTGEV